MGQEHASRHVAPGPITPACDLTMDLGGPSKLVGSRPDGGIRLERRKPLMTTATSAMAPAIVSTSTAVIVIRLSGRDTPPFVTSRDVPVDTGTTRFSSGSEGSAPSHRALSRGASASRTASTGPGSPSEDFALVRQLLQSLLGVKIYRSTKALGTVDPPQKADVSADECARATGVPAFRSRPSRAGEGRRASAFSGDSLSCDQRISRLDHCRRASRHAQSTREPYTGCGAALLSARP